MIITHRVDRTRTNKISPQGLRSKRAVYDGRRGAATGRIRPSECKD